LSRSDECWTTEAGGGSAGAAAPVDARVVVLANRKRDRDLVISQTLMDTLEELDLRYHAPVEDLSGIVVE